MSALEVDKVVVKRGGIPVVNEISLTVAPGQLVTMVGPNGGGKTTLLEGLSGIIPISGGGIRLDGRSVSSAPRRRRFEAGLVHVEQGRTVFPSLTVEENVVLTAANAGVARQAMEPFPELEKRRHSPAGLLSGGEQQMVVLARALAARPRYLIVDEMSLGLAPVVFMRLLPVFRQIADSGVGVLLVEQFAHLALGIADHALVLSGGRVTFDGPAAGLRGEEEALRLAYLGA